MLPNAVLEMPSPATTPGEVLSPSQASTFLGCAAKWYFRYALQLPDPAGGGAVRGKAVHAIVGHYLAAKAEGVTLDAQGLPDAYDAAWDAHAEGAEFAATDDVEQLKSSGRALAQKYIAEAAPAIQPALIEFPVSGTIGGVNVRGFIDIVDASGRVIDIKTASRKSSTISADHALQLATYVELLTGETRKESAWQERRVSRELTSMRPHFSGTDTLPCASGEARIDMLVSTKEPQLVQLDHAPGDAGRRLVERIYPLVAEGIAAGVFTPNRSSTLCSRRYCAYASECEREFGGSVE